MRRVRPARLSRRTWLAGGAVAAVAAVATVGALGLGGSEGAEPAVPRSGASVQVVRQTLVQSRSVDGTLGYGPETPVAVHATGTLTWLPAVGSVIARGGVLVRIDDRPTILFFGDLPMYRGLAVAADPPAEAGPAGPAATATRGRDVQQLETNLEALGYTGFTVDDTYTQQTALAVKRWQRDLGVPQTGSVEPGDVFYAAKPVRIVRTLARVGAAAGGDLVSYTDTTHVVTVDAPVGDTAWAARDNPVDIVLPDGKVIAGRVAGVGTSVSAPPGEAGGGSSGGASGGDGGQPTVPVLVTVVDPAGLGTYETAPVTVKYIVDRRVGVLAVPVAALVALAEGGYGLEVVEEGASRFVAVHTGLFADGLVEVSGGDLREGMTVRIPE